MFGLGELVYILIHKKIECSCIVLYHQMNVVNSINVNTTWEDSAYRSAIGIVLGRENVFAEGKVHMCNIDL